MATKTLEEMSVNELVDEHRKALEKNRLFDTLMSDPDTRREALGLIKKKNPAMPIPELDAAERSEAALAVERERATKAEERIRNLEIGARLDKERERVMKQYGLSDAGLMEVEKLMTDKDAPIPHYDAAAKVYLASQRQAEPSSSTLAVQTFDMPDKSTWGRGVGNKMSLDKVFREKAYEAVNAVRSGKAA